MKLHPLNMLYVTGADVMSKWMAFPLDRPLGKGDIVQISSSCFEWPC